MPLYLHSKRVPELADLPFWTRWRVTDRCSKSLLKMPRFWLLLGAVSLWNVGWTLGAAVGFGLPWHWYTRLFLPMVLWVLLAEAAGVVVLIHGCYTLIRPRLREYRRAFCGCGYDLRGSAGACPECGRERPDWACVSDQVQPR